MVHRRELAFDHGRQSPTRTYRHVKLLADPVKDPIPATRDDHPHSTPICTSSTARGMGVSQTRQPIYQPSGPTCNSRLHHVHDKLLDRLSQKRASSATNRRIMSNRAAANRNSRHPSEHSVSPETPYTPWLARNTSPSRANCNQRPSRDDYDPS
jgi:hypothetical protein